jgi:hypothetical protein
MRDHLNNERLEGSPLFFALCELYEKPSPIAPSASYQSKKNCQEISVEHYYTMLADLCVSTNTTGDDLTTYQEPESNNPSIGIETDQFFFALSTLYGPSPEGSASTNLSSLNKSPQECKPISFEQACKIYVDLCDLTINTVGDDSTNAQEPQSYIPATDTASGCNSGSNNEKKYYCLKPCLIFFSLAALSFATVGIIALEVNLLIAGLLLSLSIFLIAIGFSFISGSSFLKPYTTAHSSQNDLTPSSVETDQSHLLIR